MAYVGGLVMESFGRVWEDVWILDTQTHKAIFPRGSFVEDLMVSNLIHPISREWNKDLIAEIL